MKITFLCSSKDHPVNGPLKVWISNNADKHEISLVRNKTEMTEGDILFLISCSEIILRHERERYKHSLVIHASDLPEGRGWSPHIWEILGGGSEVTVSLLEAEDAVDTGRIWCKTKFNVPKHALWDEINEKLFDVEMELIDFAVNSISTIKPIDQPKHIKSTYYPRRTAEDSEIDAEASIASEFNKIRVCDPVRFPAFFKLHGCKYKIILEKINDE